MRSFLGRHILSLKDFDRNDLMRIFQVAKDLEPHARDRRNGDLLKHKTLITAFYQASTRTRLSTEAAMHRLGGHVMGFSDPRMTRAGDFYQETLKDTTRMLESYGDVIAMRHFKTGAPAEAARWSSIPVINCGDGWGEHPTQALIDLFTIWREKGTLDQLHVLLVGDMRMRTMRSMAFGMCKFDMTATLVYPPEMAPSDEFRQQLGNYNFRFDERPSIEDGIAEANVIYLETVVQPDYAKSREEAKADRGLTPAPYRVTRDLLFKKAKRGVIVMHSLPRLDEIPTDIDDTYHARYWVEAYNGVVVRMALLALVLGAME